MTFMNCFTQLNNNYFSELRNFFDSSTPIFPQQPAFSLPLFNINLNFLPALFTFPTFNQNAFTQQVVTQTPFNFESNFNWNQASMQNFNMNANWSQNTPQINRSTNFNTVNNNSAIYRNKPNNNSSQFKSDHTYANLNRQEALIKAQSDSTLEKLSGGNGWSISSASFKNDIPYARKGTGQILSKVSQMIGQDLTITSALGTKNSPHVKNNGTSSHYNSSNPKLDIGGGLSANQAYSLKTKLLNTGYFSRVEVETHGGTAHLDVQIKDSAFKGLDTLA